MYSDSTIDPLTLVLILTYVVAGVMLVFALIALWTKREMQERGLSLLEFFTSIIKERKRKTGVRFLRTPDGMTFGKTRSGKFACSPSDCEGHALVLGTSGSGKTSAVIIPSLRHWHGHAYVIDLGDISDNVPRASPRIVYRPAESGDVKYNVFARIDRAETDAQKQELLEELAYTLLPEATETESAERFFSEEGRKMLTAALLAYYGAGKDFPEICEWIAENNWRDLLNDIVTVCNRDPRIIRYISSFQGANEKNNQGCKQSVDRALKLFSTNETVKRSIGRGPESFSPIDLEDRDIYVQIPAEKLTLYAPLLS
jgi:type IV secretory pathway TraG/TraD family ATPase VirD4